VTAPYATTLLNGQPAYNLRFGDPQTALWFMLYAQVTQIDGSSRRNVLLARQVATLLPQTVLGKTVVTPHGQNSEPRGTTMFAAKAIAALLTQFGLPSNAGLSVLCVEILPGPLRLERTFQIAGASSNAAVAPEDPLGTQLGQRRILRTSPLTAVAAIC
jgi:hypothetical protein